jgi:hypothetical protein
MLYAQLNFSQPEPNVSSSAIVYVRMCVSLMEFVHVWGWPEPYIHTVYGRIFGDFPAQNTVFKPYIYIYIYGSGQPFSCALSRLVVYTVLSSPCCEYYACFFCYLTGKQTPLKCPMRHSDEQKQIDNQAKTNWSLLPLHLVFCCCKGPLKRPASCSQLLQLERHNFAQTAEFSV